MQKHIFVGQVKDVSVFYEAQAGSKIVKWAIPTTARFGDRGVFLLPRVLGKEHAFVSVGIISSHPEPDENRWTDWDAQITIVPFDPAFEPVELSSVQKQMTNWPAIQFPWDRSFRIDSGFEPTFANILKFKQSSSVASQFAQSFL